MSHSMDSRLKAKIARYMAASAARCGTLAQKFQHLELKVMQAQKKLAEIHALATLAADPQDIDRIYSRELERGDVNDALPDGDYSALAEQLTFTRMPEDVADECFEAIQRQAIKTQQVWADYCSRKHLLYQLEIRYQQLYNAIRRKKSFWWVFKHTHWSSWTHN